MAGLRSQKDVPSILFDQQWKPKTPYRIQMRGVDIEIPSTSDIIHSISFLQVSDRCTTDFQFQLHLPHWETEEATVRLDRQYDKHSRRSKVRQFR
jgi:hypothetical protein